MMLFLCFLIGTEVAAEASSLPAAPPAIARLMKEGKVTFDFYSPGEATRRFPALTKFDFEYAYRARHTYRVTGNEGSGRVLVVRPRFSEVQFTGKHTIELPKRFRGPRLFEESLVQHEFDHVRISADPRWEVLFRRRIEQLRVLRVPLPAGARPTQAAVDTAIKQSIEEIFRDVRQLIEIRYQELDQITRHGRTALPKSYWSRYETDVAAVDNETESE